MSLARAVSFTPLLNSQSAQSIPLSLASLRQPWIQSIGQEVRYWHSLRLSHSGTFLNREEYKRCLHYTLNGTPSI